MPMSLAIFIFKRAPLFQDKSDARYCY